MSIVTTFVGLDYHQDSVQICILDSHGKVLTNRSVENDEAVIHRVATRHGQPRRVAIEACCGAANLAEELVTRRDLPVQLAHPGYVARMKRSPDKSDLSDAHLLADLTRVNYLPKVWLAPQAIRLLRRLMRHRRQLVRRRTDTKLRIRALLRENRLKWTVARAWSKPWLAWLSDHAALPDSDRWLLEDHLEEHELGNVEVIRGDYDDPKLPKNTLDAVLILDTYHEMDDYEKILVYVRKSLRPNGKLILIEPVAEERKAWSREKQGDKHEIAIRYVVKDLEKAGFRIIRREAEFIDRIDQKGDHLWLIVAEIRH